LLVRVDIPANSSITVSIQDEKMSELSSEQKL
jgi:hypothetical protein